ncbi:SCO6745 family protein [Streptomyces roseolilacinus]|uniref:SalK n=1 Tax=Streptomyces roseolilacinus TaxID=66904 RepID=A0A918B4M8_9ACTN|nr:hypothetical protein [Streptomyces roseolilacinus]GGQ25579.1 hypothetical protein GCM10010249_50610 [Streptomyces roseolilacinus]
MDITDTPGTAPAESTGGAAARRLWTLVEPVHAVLYFAPECRDAFEAAGLRGFWRGYFAGRAAPLGAVGAEVVTAAFFSFAPRTAARAVPAVWGTVPPGEALRVRREGARAALARLLAGRGREVERAAGLLAGRLAGLDCAGRPLAAANAALPVPQDDPLDLLWHAATVLREHRGDGHVAALVAADLDGCEALALRAGTDLPRAELQPYRGWTDEEWAAAVARLAARGLLAPDGTATEAGRRLRTRVEAATDAAASRPWAGDPAGTEAVAAALAPLAAGCARALRFPNPIGVPGGGGPR